MKKKIYETPSLIVESFAQTDPNIIACSLSTDIVGGGDGGTGGGWEVEF